MDQSVEFGFPTLSQRLDKSYHTDDSLRSIPSRKLPPKKDIPSFALTIQNPLRNSLLSIDILEVDHPLRHSSFRHQRRRPADSDRVAWRRSRRLNQQRSQELREQERTKTIRSKLAFIPLSPISRHSQLTSQTRRKLEHAPAPSYFQQAVSSHQHYSTGHPASSLSQEILSRISRS